MNGLHCIELPSEVMKEWCRCCGGRCRGGKQSKEGKTVIQLARDGKHNAVVEILERRMEGIPIVDPPDREIGSF